MKYFKQQTFFCLESQHMHLRFKKWGRSLYLRHPTSAIPQDAPHLPPLSGSSKKNHGLNQAKKMLKTSSNSDFTLHSLSERMPLTVLSHESSEFYIKEVSEIQHLMENQIHLTRTTDAGEAISPNYLSFIFNNLQP